MDVQRKNRVGAATIAESRAFRSGASVIWLVAYCVFALASGCGEASQTGGGPFMDTAGSEAGAGTGPSGTGGVGGASGYSGSSGFDGVTSGSSAAGSAGGIPDPGSSPPVDSSVPDVMDGGAQDGASSNGFSGTGGSTPPTGGSGGTDASVSGTGGSSGSAGSAGGDPDLNCPAGFESQLPLVLIGDTVPGNLELGLAIAPETPRNPCGTPEEQICFNLINAERARIGKAPLIWDGDLADLGRSHAADRNQQIYPGTQHGSSTSTTHLYQERAEFLGLKNGKFNGVVENACKGAVGGEGAFNCWMGSAGHYEVMMSQGTWSMLTYAACGGDGTEWNLELGY